MTACHQNEPFQSDTVETKLDWEFARAMSNEWYPAKVPGSVQNDLLCNGLIPDPFIGTNEDSIQWVENEQWVYRATIDISKEQLAKDHLELIFEGLDTYSEVLLNNTPILESDNMFRAYTADILAVAREGANELKIRFTPPVIQNKGKLQALPYRLPAGSETVKYPVSPFTRKAAYQFGWDFAPRIVTMGIWQPVKVRSWNKARIEGVQFKLKHFDEKEAKYRIEVRVQSDIKGPMHLNINGREYPFKVNRGISSLKLDYTIYNPRLWWPNEAGEQSLYNFRLELMGEKDILDTRIERIGVRKVELVREEDDIGESFYFVVNGVKMFMKGANWSPLSSFPGSVADSVYENRLLAVKNAHMNMLRVWGGGIYESDRFYELCDELGILVWQDFMFANSLYPGDSNFLENVKGEIDYQVRRLRNHPSIALWNGNNEIDVAWKNWGWQQQFGYSAEDSTTIRTNYELLFDKMIPDRLATLDPRRPYTSTSPLSNWGNPENFTSGSMHYWGVWHGNDQFEDFKNNVGRFMVEYGFQSFPDLQTFRQYYPYDSLYADSNALLHQKSYVGNRLIINESKKYFGPSGDLETFLINSQLTQAMALKMAIEAQRLNEYCGGTLFWQLNDVWPGPSWSVIDYLGNKKVAYHVVADRFKPVILCWQVEGNQLLLNAINDSKDVFKGVLSISTEQKVKNKTIELPALSKVRIKNFTIDSLQQTSTGFIEASLKKWHDYLDRERFLIKELHPDIRYSMQ